MPTTPTLGGFAEPREKIGGTWDRDSLRQFCSICEKANLRYALETHPYRWATTATEEFEQENIRSRQYIAHLAEGLGLRVEG